MRREGPQAWVREAWIKPLGRRYTGHIHGDQHVYGITYGKMTGSILEHGVAKPVTPALLKVTLPVATVQHPRGRRASVMISLSCPQYEDTRPQRQGGMAIKF